jgi:hypothetical protein
VSHFAFTNIVAPCLNPATLAVFGMGQRRYYLCPPDLIQVKDLPPKWGLLWAIKGQVIVKREARGHPERNLLAEVSFLSSMLRRAQIRIGSRPLSEWLRGENRLEEKRGISPIKASAVKAELNG